MRTSIIITTKDRKDELREALRSAMLQDANEILVWDDGSVDGTSEMLAQEFPQVQRLGTSTSIGLIKARNELAKAASGEILFSIDDDAVFTEPGIVGDITRQFKDKALAAVAIPVVNVRRSANVLQRASGPGRDEPIRQYIGCAHAMRRDSFLMVGGYPDYLERQEEELHVAAAFHQNGLRIIRGWSDPIHHVESPRRTKSREIRLEARNLWWFALRYTPWWALVPHLAASAWNVMRHYRSPWALLGCMDAVVKCNRVPRTPFSASEFKSWRVLAQTLAPRD